MIKLRSFYPFSNFLRVIFEFHEDKAFVKTKSLTFEQEYEFDYAQVAEITYQTSVSGSQTVFRFVIPAILAITFIFLFNVIHANHLLLQVMQALYLISVVLFLGSFIKNRYYHFLDKNKKVLLTIKVALRNYESIIEVIELIRRRSASIQETGFDNPFPNSQPLFELISYDLPNYFNKCQTRFYEDEFIEFDKSILGASVSTYRYDQLSSKILRAKKGSSSWDTLCEATIGFAALLTGFYRAFDILPGSVFFTIIDILAGVTAISFLLRFVKQESIGFYDKNDRIAYFAWVNRSNKEKVEKIIEFVQSKISPATTDELLKEQA